MSLIRQTLKRWMSGEQACELLGIVGTEKTPAIRKLSTYATKWGIRKIYLGDGKRGPAVYPVADVYSYMARKEREAEQEVKIYRPKWRTPELIKAGASKKWLTARAVVYRLGMVIEKPGDSPEQLQTLEKRAIKLLNEYSRSWGIRKIEQRQQGRRSIVAYPEEDVIVYMERRQQEVQRHAHYFGYYENAGPGVCIWWGDEEFELQLQIGSPTSIQGKYSDRYTHVEVKADDSIPPLRGYVETNEVAQRFNIKPAKVYISDFWSQFRIFLGDPRHSNVRFNGDLIEMYFAHKREAGEKVFMRGSRPMKPPQREPLYSFRRKKRPE